MEDRQNLPCTGHTITDGFAQYLGRELTGSRRNIRAFADELRVLMQVPFITLVNSGSSTHLTIAAAVKELCPGRNKILTAGFSFPTTVSSFQLLGFDVVVVDTEPGGFCLDPIKLAAAIDDSVAAVVVTHFLGYAAQIKAIAEITHSTGALLVQDACETMNLRGDDGPIHQFGDFITHSFYHPHHLSSFGGGAICTLREDYWKILESITHWGRGCLCHASEAACTIPKGIHHNFHYERLGFNLELSELNACFGRFQLSRWQQDERTRWNHFHILLEALRNRSEVTLWPQAGSVSPFVYPIALTSKQQRDSLTGRLQILGVETRTLMGGVLTEQPGFRDLIKHDSLSVSRDLADRSFFVGIHQTLTTDQVSSVARILQKELPA